MAINKVGSKGIEDGSVATVDLAPGSVTNAKLTNSSFTFDGTSISLGGSDSVNLSVSWQSVVTADGSTGTTAVAGNGYFIDTTSATHTITLPSSASIGDLVAIKDYAGTFATNNLTIARNGHNIQGVANDSLITTNRASLVLVYIDSTKGWLYWEEHNVGELVPTFITATGGTITESGDFKIHTFTGDGCFVVSTLGNSPTVPTGGPSNVDYLVVAGGGGGGNNHGGGGGAGGYRTSFPSPGCNAGAFPITATTYPITVGAGGAGTEADGPTASEGSNGSNSIFSTITSTGGGLGVGGFATGPQQSGGSGGGGNWNSTCAGSGNTPPTSPSQGNPGGTGSGPSNRGGGGGGGASCSGQNAVNPTNTGGAGGSGTSNSISGSSIAYAGGGGAGSGIGPTFGPPSDGCGVKPGGAGGTGGGGAGGVGGTLGGNPSGNPYPSPNDKYNGTSGTANTGGGGGGTSVSTDELPGATAGAGGKGIVIIRYKFQ
jgi:hypothetical protein